MRLGRIALALPVVAVGLSVWRHARWLAIPENAIGMDGTCAGIEELLCYALSVAFLLLALHVLVRGVPFRDIVQFFADGAVGRRRPGPLHPSEDTTHLFD